MKESLHWFYFYIFFYLPATILYYVLGLLNISFSNFIFSIKPNLYIMRLPRWVIVVLALGIIVLNLIIIFGLYKKKKFAWIMNFPSLFLVTAYSTLSNYYNIQNYIGNFLVIWVVWLMPNCIILLEGESCLVKL